MIKKSDCIKAVNAVHSRFYASRTPLSVGIVGPGLVGKTLLAQMQEQKQTLLDKFGVDLRVVAISGGSKMHLAETGGFIDLDDWENKYSNENEAADFEKFTDHVEESNSPNQVIIDCSASDAVALQIQRMAQQRYSRRHAEQESQLGAARVLQVLEKHSKRFVHALLLRSHRWRRFTDYFHREIVRRRR